MLAASIGQHRAGTTKGPSTQRGMETLVRGGRTPSPMTTGSPMWEITTSVGILLGVTINRGASLLNLTAEYSTVLSPFALL